MTVSALAATLRRAVGEQKVCLMRLPVAVIGEGDYMMGVNAF